MRAKPFLEFVLLGKCSPVTVPLCIFEELCVQVNFLWVALCFRELLC